ncbi:helix-turn-helix domain-containing protein [Ruegeria atlantica]|uniref:Helix-turn-helix domain-containing protein n=1 Tax=Ruegeria atlantica TaxID=81569 RepID=A0ABX1WHI2_9RHOB|nr:helix-turn-helix domain-containing protein [Ruegeria atlantica]NOD32666.1 helix-turn-helix domain-containing protein [Ruegeria atlantica]
MNFFKELGEGKPELFAATVREAMTGEVFDGDVIQLGKGADEGAIFTARLGLSRLSSIRFKPNALVRTAQSESFANFTVPICASELWTVSGVPLKENSVFFNFTASETEVVARNRTSLCGRVPLQRFLKEVQLFSGRNTSDFRGPTVIVKLSSDFHAALVRTLSCIMNQADGQYTQSDLEARLARTLAIFFALSLNSGNARKATWSQKVGLVSKARECYSSALSKRPSVADLCRVTAVSAPTLISAFRDVTGETPARFFALQRLANVHDELVQASQQKPMVKQVALAHGFTDLGRFGSLYKSIYGILPSEQIERTVPI